MKHIFTTALFLSLSLKVSATCGKTEQINAVKKDSACLYSDVTLPKLEDAALQAQEMLKQEIAKWAIEEGMGEVPSTTALEGIIDTLTMQRVNQYRVFAYVRKADLLQLSKGKEVVQQDTLSASHPKDFIVGDSIRELLMQNYLGRQGGVIELIKHAKSFFELQQIMEPLKEHGDIADYGKYATIVNPEECFLIVYDPAGNIRALLGKGDDVRWNLKTNREDHLLNYRGCGAIWFRMKE